jgi:hypothetical protein
MITVEEQREVIKLECSFHNEGKFGAVFGVIIAYEKNGLGFGSGSGMTAF